MRGEAADACHGVLLPEVDVELAIGEQAEGARKAV